MSGTNTAERPSTNQAGGGAEDGADNPEDRARRMGWKPKEEYRGDPEKWKPAEDFLREGFDNPAVLADRYKVLDGRSARLERELREVRGELTGAVSTVTQMSDMLRTAEERSYSKAKRDLEAERLRAVETGDTQRFQQLEAEIRELKAPPAAPAAAAPNQGNQQPNPSRNPAGGYSDQEWAAATQPFMRENSWYVMPGQNAGPGQDAELSREADAIHVGLRSTRLDMTPEENIAETNRRLRRFFPDKFGNRQQQSDDYQGQGEENPRRREAPSYMAPSGEQPRQQRNVRNFDSMPKDAKDNFTRYAKMVEGKGKPLSKEEWANTYWAQFD